MSASPFRRTRLLALTLAALGVVPAVAGAADTVVVPGAAAQRMTALDGVVVWVAGNGSKSTLMRRGADGAVGRVVGAPAAWYPSIDLGHDAKGTLVLTYLRCATAGHCTAWSDRLDGHRTRFTKLAPRRCVLTTAPSRWLLRIAYGLTCTKRKVPRYESNHDPRRSGLFVRGGSGAAEHLPLPEPSVHEFDYPVAVRSVDLRGSTVAAVVQDPGAYIFFTTYTQTVAGKRLRSANTGHGGEDSPGPSSDLKSLVLGSGGVLWTLEASSPFEGSPGGATIFKGFTCARGTSSCSDGSGCPDAVDRLPNLTGANRPAGGVPPSMAVDGSTIYLSVPGTGIVTHTFEPDPAYEC